jgi:hypothetical protein
MLREQLPRILQLLLKDILVAIGCGVFLLYVEFSVFEAWRFRRALPAVLETEGLINFGNDTSILD